MNPGDLPLERREVRPGSGMGVEGAWEKDRLERSQEPGLGRQEVGQ